MEQKHHVIIAGTGRTGTTFIMMLLTRLGLDTGFRPEDMEQHINSNARAGLEKDIWSDDAPYIIKGPHISHYIDKVLEHPNKAVDHVFIPIRNISDATQSRVEVSRSAIEQKSKWERLFASKKGHPGGMSRTTKAHKQEAILLKDLSHLLVSLSEHFIPITFIHFPKLTTDPKYLFGKLKPLLGSVTSEDFEKIYREAVKPEFVHKYG